MTEQHPIAIVSHRGVAISIYTHKGAYRGEATWVSVLNDGLGGLGDKAVGARQGWTQICATPEEVIENGKKAIDDLLRIAEPGRLFSTSPQAKKGPRLRVLQGGATDPSGDSTGEDSEDEDAT